MGLLDEFGAWLDNKRRVMASNARDPAGLLTSLNADAGAFNAKDKSAWDATQSVMPEVRDQGSREMLQNWGDVGGLLGSTKAKGIIKDWRWKSADKVANELNVKELPEYIANGYGKFMQDQAQRAGGAELGARDLIKAYGITRSSVNRGARNMSDDLAKGETRPEGYFSEWLLTPNGKAFLDDAEKGVANKEAIADIRKRFAPFGMADTLAKDLEYAASNLGKMSGNVNPAITGPVDAWRGFAQELNGIGPSKSGFIASLLGRGDLPTFDARQIGIHTGKPAKEASKFIRRGGGAGGDAAVDRLAARQSDMGVQMAPELKPFYQHLTHHAVWDKAGGTQTTHDDLVRAMRLAGFGGAGLLGVGAADEYQ